MKRNNYTSQIQKQGKQISSTLALMFFFWRTEWVKLVPVGSMDDLGNQARTIGYVDWMSAFANKFLVKHELQLIILSFLVEF